MAGLTLKSNQQITASMISKFLSETGINDINPGSFLLTLLEAAAREDFAQYVEMLNIIRNYNLDTTTGEDLDDRAFEFGLTRLTARKASGNITIFRESSFVKVATSFYSGLPSPISGNMEIYVNDASNALFGTSGVLILGRGTSNEEEVAYSVAPINNTNYWTIQLAAPLTEDHGLDESVILKQGTDELIPAGTSVIVPASGGSPQLTFATTLDVTLLSGEDKIEAVPVQAAEAGTNGNIPIRAINGTDAFPSPPFAGARAENPAKFTTGRNREEDDELRDRIKNTIQSLSRGVKTAILNAIIGLVDPDSAKRVVSANVVLPVTRDEHVKIFIDDGTGFEPSFLQRGFESVLEAATGGERRLQLDRKPLVKAQAETATSEPYNMSAGPLTLIYNVGIDSETITLVPGDFEFPASGTAEEVVKAINNKATLIEARTSQSGTKVVIAGKVDENEDLEVTGGSANGVLNFPTDQRFTLFLYKNDVLLSKDGVTAFADTASQENYNFAGLGAGPWPLNLIVDGKSANPQVVNFVSGDFVDPSQATADEVVVAINDRLAGAVASLVSNDTKVRISSNTKNSAASKIEITGGSANTVLDFPVMEIVGRDRDYVLNRFNGTIELAEPLGVNDSLTVATTFTRAMLRTQTPESYAITLGETLVVSVDGGSDQTVTFPATGSLTAAQAAAIINAQLLGATATVRVIGAQTFLELTTNSYALGVGSLEVKSSSTAAALTFPLDTVVINQRPHRAFVVAGASGPFAFLEGQNLVVVVDGDPSTKTFTVVMDFDGTVTNGSTTSIFTIAAFNTVFTQNSDLPGFYAVAKSGSNTTTGTVDSVTNPGGSTYRYVFASLPANLSNFAAGDQVTFSNMQNLSNSGTFLVTAVNTSGNGYIEVTNAAGVVEAGSSGSMLVGQRRQIASYVASVGTITLAAPFSNTPAIGNSMVVIPRTSQNLVRYLNNTKVTTLSTKAFVELANNSARVQISSKSNGSDGSIQVTGGSANPQLMFSTVLFKGLQGYNYYTGLLELVHKTIWGEDQDLESFSGIGAAGIDFEVLGPTTEEIKFNLDVTLAEGFTLSNVEDEIRSAVTGYVNNLGIGNDVILAEIINAVMLVDGITDVSIVSPTQNIIIADEELPRTRDALITLG